MIADPVAVFFALAAVVFISIRLERTWRVFRSLGAAMVAILLSLVL